MLTVYAEAARDARPRPSDRYTGSGTRLQFIGTRATVTGARALAQRESLRVNGIAIAFNALGRQIATYVAGKARSNG